MLNLDTVSDSVASITMVLEIFFPKLPNYTYSKYLKRPYNTVEGLKSHAASNLDSNQWQLVAYSVSIGLYSCDLFVQNPS